METSIHNQASSLVKLHQRLALTSTDMMEEPRTDLKTNGPTETSTDMLEELETGPKVDELVGTTGNEGVSPSISGGLGQSSQGPSVIRYSTSPA